MVGYVFPYKNSKRKQMETKKEIEPKWLELLLKTTFFGVCEDHKEMRKSEINIFCIECELSMCSLCLAEDLSHRFHRVLQIRRYVYQDVVRIHDIQKYFDCSKVQPYTVNSAKVVLLIARRQSKPSKIPIGSAACKICRRSIVEPNRYCSIGCKVSDGSTVEIWNPERKNRSGPLISPRTPELEELAPKEKDDPCSHLELSSQPSDSAEDDGGRWIGEENAMSSFRKRGRKGFPCRAPLL